MADTKPCVEEKEEVVSTHPDTRRFYEGRVGYESVPKDDGTPETDEEKQKKKD
jgi:hypothetical protein